MVELQTQIPLQDVAKRYGIPPEVLTRLAQDGIIRATNHNAKEERTVSISTVAAAASIIEKEIRPEQYEHLRGKRIRLMEASRDYGTEHSNLIRWAERGYIQVLDHEILKMTLDAADVAYVSEIFERAIKLTGSPIRAGWVLKRIFA